MNHDTIPLSATSSQTPALRAWRRLHALGRVGLRATACIAGRTARSDCRHCADACPAHCLTVSEGALALDPIGCTNCGLCAAACPTGALAVEGFQLPDQVPPTGLLVKCERSRLATGGAAHCMPCLGGLALDDWLRLALDASGAPIRVFDDSACKSCPNAPQGAPWLAALDSARHALAAAGVPEAALPSIVTPALLPNGNALHQGAPDQSVAAGRRRFFGGLSRSLASGVAQTARDQFAQTIPDIVPARLRGHGATPRGQQTRLILLAIAQRHGRPHPQSALLPNVESGAGCRAHGTCTRICPTGALQLVSSDDEGATELRFDAWRCIDCGACAAHCPEQALHHTVRAWCAFATAPATLAIVAGHACPRCGAELATADEDALCDRCSKSENLARAGFALFNRHHRETPAQPEGP
jgi:formate hydrogenlyase subunit 6/NADH:ubiquinone oxidoreductase subunit I